MKNTIQKQITSYFITFTVVSALTILSSCSADSAISTPVETTESNKLSETPPPAINKNPILLWDFIRKDSAMVRKIFAESGNKFSFQPDSGFYQKTVHVYLGYNANPKIGHRLNFMFITKDADKENNDSFINRNGSLPSLEYGDFNSYKENTIESKNVDAIAWKTASQRVKNWENDSIRQVWINAQFDTRESTISQAFVINGIDFEANTTHDCYLALKDTIIEKTTIYTADLIIVNTVTKKVVSLIQNGTTQLEDVTAPIPPFKPGTRTDKKYFGLLKTLKIK